MKTLNVIGNHNGGGQQSSTFVPAVEPALRGWPTLAAVMSVPRLGFMDNFFCWASALFGLQAIVPTFKVPIRKYTGAFWGQCLTRTIADSMERDNTDVIMTIDYDTIFTTQNLVDMLDILAAHPEVDALAPLQMHRIEPRPLFSMRDSNGRAVTEVATDAFDGPIAKIHTAHMGCMMFRAKSLLKCKKPWFLNVPDPHGGWEAGRLDEDTYFWERWAEAGNTLYLANRVVVGHLELMVRWPDKEFGFIDQHPGDFFLKGAPEGVWT